jgi:putative spermidine/putrescine transport system substrate-binding protein
MLEAIPKKVTGFLIHLTIASSVLIKLYKSMLNRRSFLIGAGTFGVAQFLAGCGAPATALKVLLLKGSIPPQLLGKFRQQIEQENALSLKPESQLKDLFKLLQTWQEKPKANKNLFDWVPLLGQKTPTIADLVTLGDYWLARAIQEKLIQPLQVAELPGWQKLPPRWQSLVKRNSQGNLDENGQIWGAPYRWGTTMIAYRQDKFKKLGWQPTDWGDLWREELRDRISLLDQPREVIGLTLRKLGHSYNSLDLTKIANLKSELMSLHNQVKFYSSDYYLQPLILGDTWLAVGWSHDILSLQSRYPNIKAVIPQSGTALWADVWVKPASVVREENRLAIEKKWLDFCWQPQPAQQISLLTDAASPIILSLTEKDLPKDIKNNSLLLVNQKILKDSEFLFPLPEVTLAQYVELWKEVRQI